MSLMAPFFFPLLFVLVRSFSSLSFGKTDSRTAAMMRGKAGLFFRRSHESWSIGSSMYIRHSSTVYFVIRRYLLVGAMVYQISCLSAAMTSARSPGAWAIQLERELNTKTRDPLDFQTRSL